MNFFCLSLLRVEGHSMLPNFRPGQYVLASSIPYWFSKPKVGDIVVIADSEGGHHLLKRIIKAESNRFWLAGDNNKDSRDSRKFGWVLRNAVLGKIVL